MNKSDFDGLVRSFRQAKVFLHDGKRSQVRVQVPGDIDVAAIRAKTSLSQAAFSRQIGVSVVTLRNWEQARRTPDGPARVLLAMLKSDPEIVVRTLRKAA
jgi:putative transcriptional regulator